jgi:hypothetical protein
VVAAAETLPARHGWLLNREFDLTFVHGVAALALLSGCVVVWKPELFSAVLVADLWLLGYHHVIATYTRLAFDRDSLREHRFFVFALPPIVLATTFFLAWAVGIWVIATIYLYWQWFHYTRQSWGISQVYRAKSNGLVSEGPVFSKLCFYLVPLWGILYRSWQAPETFLFVELRVIPVPGWLVAVVGLASAATVAIWCFQRLRMWWEGRLPIAHTWYMISHFVVFIVGYWLIEDITFGWLVINVWHNAQYILFVWLFNTRRFAKGVDSRARFLSKLSQPGDIVRYLAVCLGISTLLYGFAALLTYEQQMAGLPLAIIVYQAVNFHHYVVDSRIWKVRKKPMRKTLELDEASS